MSRRLDRAPGTDADDNVQEHGPFRSKPASGLGRRRRPPRRPGRLGLRPAVPPVPLLALLPRGPHPGCPHAGAAGGHPGGALHSAAGGGAGGGAGGRGGHGRRAPDQGAVRPGRRPARLPVRPGHLAPRQRVHRAGGVPGAAARGGRAAAAGGGQLAEQAAGGAQGGPERRGDTQQRLQHAGTGLCALRGADACPGAAAVRPVRRRRHVRPPDGAVAGGGERHHQHVRLHHHCLRARQRLLARHLRVHHHRVLVHSPHRAVGPGHADAVRWPHPGPPGRLPGPGGCQRAAGHQRAQAAAGAVRQQRAAAAGREGRGRGRVGPDRPGAHAGSEEERGEGAAGRTRGRPAAGGGGGAAAAPAAPSLSPRSPRASEYFPLQLNSSGMMSIVLGGAAYYGFLPRLVELAGGGPGAAAALASLQSGPLGLLGYGLTVAALEFLPLGGINPKEMAEYFNTMNVGLQGVVPGEPTERELRLRLLQCKAWGGACLAALAVAAQCFDGACVAALGTSLGTTSLIIIVGAVLQTARQVEGLLEGPKLQRRLDAERGAIQSLRLL